MESPSLLQLGTQMSDDHNGAGGLDDLNVLVQPQ